LDHLLGSSQVSSDLTEVVDFLGFLLVSVVGWFVGVFFIYVSSDDNGHRKMHTVVPHRLYTQFLNIKLFFSLRKEST